MKMSKREKEDYFNKKKIYDRLKPEYSKLLNKLSNNKYLQI